MLSDSYRNDPEGSAGLTILRIMWIVIGSSCLAVVLGILAFGIYIGSQPTADQLYGCTPKDQLPSGDCP